MADLEDVGGKRRHRRQHHIGSPSPSDVLGWEPTIHPTLDSLPYRTRSCVSDADIQMPDNARTRTKHSASSSHRGRRASEDLRPNMPVPTTLTRSRTESHRRGKEVVVYEEDVESSPSRDRRFRPGPRRRERSPSRSSSTSDSERSSSRSEVIMTPPRSRHINYATPGSKHSYRSGSSRRTPSADSAGSAESSTQVAVKEILRRHSPEFQVESDVEQPLPRQHPRRRRETQSAIYEEPAYIYRHDPPIVTGSADVSKRHHTHHSNSRSSSRRRPHRNRDYVGEEVIKPSSSKRGHKSYHGSDSVYWDRPKLPRSSSSHVNSTVSTSSRRSSSVISKFVYGPTGHPSTPAKTVECVACLDQLSSKKAAKLRCKHYMCHSCMKRVFKVSIKDPQHMPPKCCTEEPIPVKHVDRLFDISFKKTWNKKFAEYSTRNRIYCPSKHCSTWIKPERIQKLRDGRKRASCSNCRTEVCCACHGKWHKSKDCPGDEATLELLRQAEENGWQQCYKCNEMVELKEGCNHMTCRCGAEFCMICGVKWKGCDCPWFNYDAVEQDRLEHTTTPLVSRERERPAPRESRGQSSRQRIPKTYDEEVSLRRVQERHDEDYARRIQYEDDDEDYIGSYGDIVGLGNSAGHFMNDDYRRAPRVIPPAPSPPMQAVDRPSNGDYVTGVNKARGVRASSMERRLADRFSESRQGTSPNHRSFTVPIHPPPPPPPPPGMGMSSLSGMSPPPPPPPGGPFIRRAHTMDEDMYGSPSHSRLSERITPGRVRDYEVYEIESPSYIPSSRRRHRERERDRDREIPKDSVLAGLTGPGSGMNRVHEWRNYVSGDPDGGIAAN